jgi:hypothetical protein
VGTEAAENGIAALVKENGTAPEDEVGVGVPNAKGADVGGLLKAPKEPTMGATGAVAELVFEAEDREKVLVVIAVKVVRAFAVEGMLEANGPSLAFDFTVESVPSTVAAAPNVDEEVGAGVVKENAVEAGADENEETDDANDEGAKGTNGDGVNEEDEDWTEKAEGTEGAAVVDAGDVLGTDAWPRLEKEKAEADAAVFGFGAQNLRLLTSRCSCTNSRR